MHQKAHGNLIAQQLATDAVRKLHPLLERIQRRDRNLADQLRRAATSCVLNLAEAAYNTAGNRRMRLESARGSANEARAALEVAGAWGYVSPAHVAELDALYDRVLALTFRLWARA